MLTTSSRLKLILSALVAPTLVLGLAACAGSGDTASSPSGETTASGSAAPKRGGSVIALLGSAYAGNWPSGLDPATNATAGANFPQNQAIFGGLFLLEADDDGSNARIVPHQAASAKLSSDAMTLTIKLRPGIKFSDGTPFDAEAVIWNFKRDTDSSCACAPTWKLREKDPFTSPDPLTVVVHFSQPNAAIVHSFPFFNANWIASPTAFRKMGAKTFKLKPVGAGPFTVVSDKLSTRLVLKRNPNYFKENLPYLDKLTFQSIDGDQAAYQALLAGKADAYEDASTQPVIREAQSKPNLQVTIQPGTSPYVVRPNTLVPPFDNIKAREAIYYATDWQAINEGLFGGKQTVVQGFTTPAGLYYHKNTPGYRTYDLAKAKQLVQQLGGLSFQLDTLGRYTPNHVIAALQTQYEKAGMDVTIESYQLSGLIKRYNSGKWQLNLGTAGAWDPASGTGLAFHFRSDSPVTGVQDKHLDALMKKSVSVADDTKRDEIYQEIAKYISAKAYGIFGFAVGQAKFAVEGLHAPGLTTKVPALAVVSGVIWGQAWIEGK